MRSNIFLQAALLPMEVLFNLCLLKNISKRFLSEK
jgi:hypothetical protein